ncbi:MAG: helicase-related protein [Chloroflexota bacterium]|nr:helicase-related protein [Chloroflexota bacterium]
MELQVGQLITAPFLPTPAEVKKFEPRSGYSLLEVVLDDGHHTYKPLRITDEQLAQIEVLERNPIALTDNAEDFFFLIEANRIRLAYQFDPQLAVSVSQVDPLPHQIEAVYRYVLESPRIRFLIADDPGAGKTIMAGLILKELQYRRLVRRVLIVAPGHLKYQWQREMKERFQTSFAIVDRARIESAWGENVWEERDCCITSIDFIKRDEIRATLRSARWDLVIVDEAHKMSAYAYQGRKRVKIDKTKRYQVGEVLSRQTNHLLFLTATPHKGDEENFRLFLDLLRPGFFAQTTLLKESVERKDNPIFVRRLKEDMRRFDGSDIFPPRHVHTVPFRLTADEVELYNGVTRYVQDYFDKAKENRSITFALMILQRRLTSSTHAIYESLKRRKARLEELLALPEKIRQDEDYLRVRNISEEELEDMAEEERARIEERLEHLTIARNIEDVHAEIAQLDRLIAQAERVRRQEIESKLVGLRDHVLKHLEDRKLLIFTEFRDTLNYLVGKLRGWGYSVTTIHGQMNMDARIQAEHEFRDKAQIMVATEAAGEGINLQFCSLMVNYDIPWNPNRLEQRMGRIHRYGQNYEVHIWNMISRDTREGQILDRLFEKLDRIRKALGSDRVFDIIGEIIPGSRLDELLKDAIFNQRRMEEIEQHIEAVDEQTVHQTLERVFMTSLATRHIDYTGILKETLTAEENRLVPEYVEDYFLRALRRLGGTVERRGDNSYAIPSVPFELRRWGDDYSFKTTYGTLFREYRRVTFDKAHARAHPEAEFVAPGHPLLEAVNQQILTTFGDGTDTYAVFGDPEGQREGILWFVEGDVTDGAGQPAGKRVFCLYQTLDGMIQQVNPAVLWDHQPLSGTTAPPGVANLLRRRDAIEDYVVTQVLLPFREEIAARREHEARVKEKYGLRSLDYLIQESNQKILDYQMRQAVGEQVDLPLLNEQRNLEQLQQRRAELEREIRLERNLTVGEPRIIGAAAVVPLRAAEPEAEAEEIIYEPHTPGIISHYEERASYEAGPGMRRDEEIEAAGMQVAMGYEDKQGWHPEDVSGENHGFDVRSTRYNPDGTFADIRYVEVKARARSGAIRLSANEWKKARHFNDKFWLYIVTEAASDAPQLHRIQNPAAHFQLDEDIFATGFILPEEKWRRQVP